jgi:hypothetical protein
MKFDIHVTCIHVDSLSSLCPSRDGGDVFVLRVKPGHYYAVNPRPMCAILSSKDANNYGIFMHWPLQAVPCVIA